MIFRLNGEILPSRREFAVGIHSDQDTDRQGRLARPRRERRRDEGGEANARDTRIDPTVERREKRSREILVPYLAIYPSIRDNVNVRVFNFLSPPLVRLSGEPIVLLVQAENEPVWIIAKTLCH